MDITDIAELHGLGQKITIPPYERPIDWLPLDTPISGEQRFVGLYAIFERYDNRVAVKVTGDHTIDWGDGVIENFASDIIAEHEYTYASIDVDTISSRGYKQVIITITPQVGSNITALSLSHLHSLEPANVDGLAYWLDVAMNLPNASSIEIGRKRTDDFINDRSAIQFLLESVYIGECNLSGSADYMFCYCSVLQKVNLFDTSNITSASRFMNGCFKLSEHPEFDFSSVTTLNRTFRFNNNLLKSKVTTSNALLDVARMYAGCVSIKRINEFNTSNVTSMEQTFRECKHLGVIPNIDTSNVTNFSFSLYATASKRTFPRWNFIKGNNFSYAFSFAGPLREIPNITTSATGTTDWRHAFSIGGLRKVGVITCSSNASLRDAFAEGAEIIDDFIFSSGGGTFQTTFTYKKQLRKIKLTGTTGSVILAHHPLTRLALIDLFNSLGTVVGQTITITGCIGTSSLTGADISIATNKGWTVVT